MAPAEVLKFDEEDLKKEHKFWHSQPMQRLDENAPTQENCAIENKTLDDVRKKPLRLPAAFEWVSVDITNEQELDDVYTLLAENYVEDDEGMFRFDYPKPFLHWVLTPPDVNKDFIIGVRQKNNGKLRGFITGIPAHMHVYDKAMKMVEINFLCVHKALRSQRLAPILIKEVTRRVNLTNVWQAVYTAGVVLPKPVGRTRYYHRSLNVKKLVKVGFSRLNPKLTMSMQIKLYAVPKQPQIPGVREMVEADVKQVARLFAAYMPKFSVRPSFSEAEIAHWFLPRDGVIYSYVVEGNDGKITDFFSFYGLPSQIMKHPTYKMLNACYSFYNIPGKHTAEQVLQDAIIMAKQQKYDVMNALDVMENGNVFETLKFGKGDGQLNYYIYNWKCPEMPPERVGLVLM
jgi:glycylpeptide N-tetradecanoyltransferase